MQGWASANAWVFLSCFPSSGVESADRPKQQRLLAFYVRGRVCVHALEITQTFFRQGHHTTTSKKIVHLKVIFTAPIKLMPLPI